MSGPEEVSEGWLRGNVLVGAAQDATGKELQGRHYWVLLSRNNINSNPRHPVIVVPILTHRAGTVWFETDIKVPAAKSPTGVDSLIRCQQIRALDRSAVKPVANTKMCSGGLMLDIETKIVEVLAMAKNWKRK